MAFACGDGGREGSKSRNNRTIRGATRESGGHAIFELRVSHGGVG